MQIRNGGPGRDERFRALYQKYYRRMVKFYVQAFRLAEEDAEELTQEAFLRFYQAMDEYRGDAEWAFFETIARNLAYNRIRAQKTGKRNAPTVAIDDRENFKAGEPQAPEVPDYAERQEAERRTRLLREAIAKLPPGQRACVQLWLQGFKYEEIAKALRISLDAVKSRIRDARRLLSERLGAPLPEVEE